MVYLQFLGRTGQLLNAQGLENEIFKEVPPDATDWTEFTLSGQAPPAAHTLRIWIHSTIGGRVVADVDDFSLTESGD